MAALRVLITGAGGFVGQHLTAHLSQAQPQARLYGTTLLSSERVHGSLAGNRPIDLKDADAVLGLLAEIQPESIYHLAAQAFVPRSFEDPWETLENNVRSQLNIILACLELDLRPRLLVVSSAEIYGAVAPERMPMAENTPIRPTNPYSVSKVAQDMLALQYYLSHGFPIMRARPFNHIGPGQDSRFVAPALAMQIARIEEDAGHGVIKVGNLEAKRDFTDVRDIVRAYRLIIENGRPGQAYNVASGVAYSIRRMLDILLGLTEAEIQVTVDQARLRPIDVPEIRGDSSKLRADTNWKPTLTFEDTLKDVLMDCRERCQLTKD